MEESNNQEQQDFYTKYSALIDQIIRESGATVELSSEEEEEVEEVDKFLITILFATYLSFVIFGGSLFCWPSLIYQIITFVL